MNYSLLQLFLAYNKKTVLEYGSSKIINNQFFLKVRIRESILAFYFLSSAGLLPVFG